MLDTIKSFLFDKAFNIGSFNVLWWYVIVAAAALVVLLIVITIAVAVSKKKKKKKANAEKAEEPKNSVHKKKNAAQVQPFSDVAPDWQPVAVASKKSKKEQKQAEKQAQADAKHAEQTNDIVEEPVAEQENEIVAEPVAEQENGIVAEPVAKEEPIAEPAQQIVTEQPVVTPTQQAEPVAKPAPAAAERIEKVENKQNVAVAEKIRPVNNSVAYVAPKAEPKQAVVAKPVEKTVAEPKPTYTRTTVVTPTPVVENTAEQETAATTPPRALPKKTNKTTKKTADQIANDIEGKTGTDPRKRSDKPAIVGQDKLPKKATKAQKNEAAKANTNELAEGELPLITTDPNVESFGKFIIIKNDDNSTRPFHFRLLANNGQILFESESYKSKPKSNSIIAFKKAAAIETNFEIDADKAGNWRYKLYNAQHAVIGVGESYSTKQGCENSVQSVIKFAESARLLEDQTEA